MAFLPCAPTGLPWFRLAPSHMGPEDNRPRPRTREHAGSTSRARAEAGAGVAEPADCDHTRISIGSSRTSGDLGSDE